MNKRVAIALSGGVDSAIAARLLQNGGYDVFAVSMLLCTADMKSAAEMAERLGIDHYVLDFRREFEDTVINYFLDEYAHTRTPNPCCVCNKHIKFGRLWEEAHKMGADYLATGHYAQIIQDKDGYHLLKGVDIKKDQSYFLHTLSQEQLSHILLPLGALTKEAVKLMATELGLTPNEGESQDICFIEGDYRDFIKDKIPMQKGDILDARGKKLGEHEGLPLYTIGQRQGLGVAASKRLYVSKLDIQINAVTLSPIEKLNTATVTAKNISWIAGFPPADLNVDVKVRYGGTSTPATLELNQDGTVTAALSQSVFAPASGQFMVFYRGDEVLGGGVIV